MSELVTVDREGPTALLTLNSPHRRNVLSGDMVAAISAALDDIEADPEIRAVVVTGSGAVFCAGAELDTLERAAAGDFALIREVYSGFLRVLHSPLLTIGAINGAAVGAGFNLALACDVRIAADTARFVCRFDELHILPGGGHTWMLTRAVGHQRALAALMLRRPWSATDALADGLVLDVVAPGDLRAAALDLAAPLAGSGADYTRRLVSQVRAMPAVLEHGEALEIEAKSQEWSTRQPDFLDGLADIRSAIASRSRVQDGGRPS